MQKLNETNIEHENVILIDNQKECMINDINWFDLRSQFQSAEPFNHIVIDNFFKQEIAEQLHKDFPEYDSKEWIYYNNVLENKKSCNSWDKFPNTTYSAFDYLMSGSFINLMNIATGIFDLHGDIGLHGGGWHVHNRGGKLNVHLDYEIHPKLLKQRKLNIIIYMTPEWESSWGGGLELWSNDSEIDGPKECVKVIDNVFNRAVIFDTTQKSWHGIPREITCPEGVLRRSLAAYYLTSVPTISNNRNKALFAPYGDQVNDHSVLEIIRKRANIIDAEQVYRR